MIALMCRELKMPWTTGGYVQQPKWFTDILKMMRKLESDKAIEEAVQAEKEAKVAQRKARHG